MHGRGRGRGRGQAPAADRLPSVDFVLRLLYRSGPNRALRAVPPYQDVPNQDRYPADDQHRFNDEDHRRSARMLGIILGARVATVDNPLWSGEIVDVMGELQVLEPALSDVLLEANRLPPEYTGNVLAFRRLDARSRVFYHQDRL